MLNRNILFLIIGVLAVATVFLSYRLYEERRQATIGISVSDHEISIEKH